MRLRSLLLAPIALVTTAAADPNLYWSIADESGKAIGYGYTETSGTLDGLVVTDYRELAVHMPGRAVRRVTDRITTRRDNSGARDIAEQIDDDGAWTDIHAVIEGTVAVVTRTTRAGRQVRRLALPPNVRVFNYDMFAPTRCVAATATGFLPPIADLDLADMAVERIDDGEMLGFGAGGIRVTPRRRYRGDALHSIDRMGYDGDCHLAEVVKSAFGMTVRLKPTTTRPRPIG
ncbi:hypothetical protein [Sphingomonas sp.]|jgi:hypothetical protein|uniref:hypothetical protein n=1 Tax=Sphingomonas sp. TaxID=28214 RepID=UPI002E37D3CF|nr:hypothetical protein [Sphingomonas sp.]HEX4693770.1 hypothetical protein [Sphingomonas sp.]